MSLLSGQKEGISMSKKSGPLTTVEKFYIDNNQDKNVKELAKDLNRNQKIVREYSGSPEVSKTAEAKGEKEPAIAGDLFGHTVQMPNSNTIVVGAPHQASASADAIGGFYVFTGEGANWTETQLVTYTGAVASDEYGRPATALSATQKEVFIGGIGSVNIPSSAISSNLLLASK